LSLRISGANAGKRVVTYLGADKTPRPTSNGAFAEQVATDSELVAVVPDTMSMAQATTLPVGAFTAYLLLEAVEPAVKQSDDAKWVLVWGASSSVGHFAVQLAAKQGWNVIAVASGAHKELALKLGAKYFVDYRKDDVPSKVSEILASNGGGKLYGVMDPISSGETLQSCQDLIVAHSDSSALRIISSTGAYQIPKETHGVKYQSISFGAQLDSPEAREWMISRFPTVLSLQPQSVKSVPGPYTAETVEKAFSISQKGVSGEKVVIEWTK
jgi:D-arabinose 1-dehydrogenase-like Zn-dependent alcohol dehydrogenase